MGQREWHLCRKGTYDRFTNTRFRASPAIENGMATALQAVIQTTKVTEELRSTTEGNVKGMLKEEAMGYRRTMSSNSLTGDRVVNGQAEDLGKIEDIMIDIVNGSVAYAVLSFGGFLGMGNKLFAIPWTAMRLDEAHKCFILDVDKKTLESAPGFDKDNWPDFSSDEYARSIQRHWS